jgi:hypothetical protein
VSLWSPAPDTSAADWLVGDITTFAESVLSLVPSGFAAYCRVFHPAWRWGDVPGRRAADRTGVRWADIAAFTGAHAHAAMQLPAVTRNWRTHVLEGVYDQGPTEGQLDVETAAELVAVLSRHTTTPERCWFGVWEGWGEMRGNERQLEIRSAPLFELPKRRYHLLLGPIEAAPEGGHGTSPNIWWPEDRAWCVTSEIDYCTSYVASSETCCDEIVASPALEASAIGPAAGITFASDPLNPLPPRG